MTALNPAPEPQQVTRLLERLRGGDAQAAERVYELLQAELRHLADREMRRQEPGHSLQPTALVNEAWIKLVGGDGRSYDNRGHFLGVAAKAMRSVLVDHARAKRAARRGGGALRVELDDALAAYEERAYDLVALDDALEALARVDERLARIVELRFFAGLEHGEVAEALGISLRTVERDWRTARAWLHERLVAADHGRRSER